MHKVTVEGVEKDIPQGVEAVGEEDLFYVPFSLLVLADDAEDETDYRWTNPRRLGDGTVGAGFGKQDMEELYTDLKNEGLMCPLICRWVQLDDGIKVQILDGERRFRSMQKQLQKNEQVWSRRLRSWLPAEQVHSKIPCRIITGNDKQALKIAFMVSDRSVGWGEGATAKLIRKLRKCNCTDTEILDLTQKSGQWLREMDRICDLDDVTFSYLTDARINRALALKLADIIDIERRHKYLHAAYDDAVSGHQEVVAKADEELLKAEEKEEIADGELVEVQATGTTEQIAEAETKLIEVRERTEQKRRQRAEATRPRAKTANLRSARAKLEEDGETTDDIATPLRPGKIKKQQEMIAELINRGGKPEGEDKELFPLSALQLVAACYKAVLVGEEDIIKVIKREKTKQALLARRQAMHDATDDDEDDEVEENDDE
jgi:hypothetical protein